MTIQDSLKAQLVDNAGDAVIYCRTDGTIAYLNAAAERILQLDAGEALDQSLDIIIPEKHRPAHWSGWEKVVASGETRYGGDTLNVPAIRGDGERISLEFTVMIATGDDGAVAGIGAIMRDVTAAYEEKKRLIADSRKNR